MNLEVTFIEGLKVIAIIIPNVLAVLMLCLYINKQNQSNQVFYIIKYYKIASTFEFLDLKSHLLVYGFGALLMLHNKKIYLFSLLYEALSYKI